MQARELSINIYRSSMLLLILKKIQQEIKNKTIRMQKQFNTTDENQTD